MLFWKQSFWLIKPFSSGPLNFTKLYKPVLEKCPSSLGEAPVFNFTVLRVLSDFSLCLTLSNLVDCSLPWDSPGKNNGVGCHAHLQEFHCWAKAILHLEKITEFVSVFWGKLTTKLLHWLLDIFLDNGMKWFSAGKYCIASVVFTFLLVWTCLLGR